MSNLFLILLNRSIAAGWLVLAIVALRLLLKKAPQWIRGAFWGLVALRLVCPVSVESVLSLIPSAETVPVTILTAPVPSIQSGIPLVNHAVNPLLGEKLAPPIGESVNPAQILAAIAAWIWLCGVVVILMYAAVSLWRVKRQVREAARLTGHILQCDGIDTPFILGTLRPKIYLPSSLCEQDAAYVVAHEQAHLRRLDHLWKPLGFVLLAVYWFNPILWVAYRLFCRDMELACDEKVIRAMGEDAKAPYDNALIHCAAPQKRITACPLAFGETSVKQRIQNALHYKKPALWVIVAALVACAATAVCFLTNPKPHNTWNTSYAYYNTSGWDKSTLSLIPETRQFQFVYSYLSSYIAIGTYEQADGYLRCHADDNDSLYTFRREGDTLVFVADQSAAMPAYRYQGDSPLSTVCVPDGAVFRTVASKEEPPASERILKGGAYSFILDSCSFDIDGDGKAEHCMLSPGPTSGLFTFKMSVMSDTMRYENTFNSDYTDLRFQAESGQLKLCGVKREAEAVLFDITFDNGNIVLSENGKPSESFGYWGKQGIS